MVYRRIHVDGAEVEALYLSGLNLAQVGERLDISTATVARTLVKRGVPTRPQGTPPASPTPDGVVEMFRRLGSVTAVIAETGIPRKRINRVHAEAGVPVIKPVDVERAVKLYKSGVGLPAIAKELKVNHGRVSAALREAGVPIRRVGTYPRKDGGSRTSKGTDR